MAPATMFSLLLLSFYSIVVCSGGAATTTITPDVSAAIEQTLHIFNPTTTTPLPQQKEDISSSSSSFSLPLYPRVALYPPHLDHKDYQSLTLSRLARNSARVQWVNAKIKYALSSFNRSQTDSSLTQQNDLSAPVTSFQQTSGEYIARIGIGSPMVPYDMLIDSASDLIWVQCKPCHGCTGRLFDPSGSSTYSSVPCNSSNCSSHSSFTETLSFDNSTTISKVVLGCVHNRNNNDITVSGLIGLGRGPASLPSQAKSKFFSYCLVDFDTTNASTLELKSAPPLLPTGSIIIPLLQNPKMPTFLYIGMTGISVGRLPLSIPHSSLELDIFGNGGVIMDSSTIYSVFTTPVYNSLRDAFVQQAKNLKLTDKYYNLDTCFDLSQLQVTKVAIPTVSFQFEGGTTLELRPENYLIPVDPNGKFCLAFTSSAEKVSIIGSIQQQGIRIGHDLVNNIISFSPNSC